MLVVILSIGDELVLGQTIDTNSAYLSAQLAAIGIGTRYHQTVADDRALIAEAIDRAADHADLVLVTGGLGPTDDDLTREALADAMHAPLVEDARQLQHIRDIMERRGRPMPPRNAKQALCPKTAATIDNSCGTAPGIKASLHGATIYVTPGVPSELFRMWELSILPEIKQAEAERDVILTTKINTFGLGESTIAEQLGALMDRRRNPKVGTTVSDGLVSVRIRSEFAHLDEARRQLEDTAAQVTAALGAVAFGRDDQSLQEATLAMLIERGHTLATAESCTGGLLGAMITDVAGSSAAYAGGWVTYSNTMKTAQLGVPTDMLEAHGAVSQQVAACLAQAALEKSAADYALSITGIAGPDGGTAEKPVGLVWVGLAQRDGEVETIELRLSGDRERIRHRAVLCALQTLRFAMLGLPFEDMTWGTRVSMPAGA